MLNNLFERLRLQIIRINKLNPNWTIVSTSIMTLLLIVLNNQAFFYVFSIYLFVLLIFNIHGVIFAWMILVPFEATFRQMSISSPFTPFLTIFTLFIVYKLLSNNDKRFSLLVFPIIFLFISTLAFINLGLDVQQAKAIILLASVILIIPVMLFFFMDYDQALDHVTYSLIFITCFALIFATRENNGLRLTLGGNVRNISNLLGTTITLLLYRLFKSLKELNRYSLLFKHWQNLMMLSFMIFFMYFLNLTLSRGVILAVLFVIISFFGLEIVLNFNRKKLFLFIASFFIIIVLSFLFINSSLPTLLGLETLFFRFRWEFLVNNVRFDLWRFAISKLSVTQLIFGIGLSRFKDFVADGGFIYYAHSVFIDALVSMGIIGLLSIFWLFIRPSINTLRKLSFGVIPILIYLLISFATHGNVFSKYFWLLMSIAMSIDYVSNKLEMKK